MKKLQINNFWNLDHKEIWKKALIGMSCGFFVTLIISIVLKLTTINLKPEINPENSLHLMVQIQNYLRFLTPFAIGTAIGYALKLNIYQILTCGIVAIISAHSTLVPIYDAKMRIISFAQARLGIDFFASQTGDIFAPLVSVVIIVYIFKVFSLQKNYFEILFTPLFGIAWAILATMTISPLSALFFAVIKYIIGVSIVNNYWLGIVFAPMIGFLIGLALPMPVSSVALVISLDLNGSIGLIALTSTSTVATVIALMTYIGTKSFSKTFVIFFGTPMLLMDKYFKNHRMLFLPLFASIVTSVLSAAIFDKSIVNLEIKTQATYVGMGFTGFFLAQILLLIDNVWWIALLHILILQILCPIVITYHGIKIFFKKQWLNVEDFQF